MTIVKRVSRLRVVFLFLLFVSPTQLLAAGGTWGTMTWGAGEWTSSTDFDGDGVANAVDNCPNIANPAQLDANNNGVGNACDTLSDSDGDGFTDAEEFVLGTDPLVAEYPIKVTSPNGGETLFAGTTITLTWQDETDAGHYTLRYSTNGGSLWREIATSAGNVRSWTWTVPDAPFPKSNCLFRVFAYDTGGQLLGADGSDAMFTIVPPPLALTSPNGGETLVGQSQTTIDWFAPPSAESFKLRYSMSGGQYWTAIDLNVGNVRTYTWTLPDVLRTKTNCLVKVQSFNGAGQYLDADVSDVPFTIDVAPTAITSPNGGESWQGGTQQTINWTAPGKATSFTLRYSPNNGAIWTLITDTIPGTERSYTWTLPTYASPKTTLIRIQAFNKGGRLVGEDDSDASFIITP
jgi:hypothetical protein